MTLVEELKSLHGNKRHFLLLRVLGIGTDVARQLVGISRGTYNSWLQNAEFVELYRRKDELSLAYRQEALQIMRRDNQLRAVLLEEKIIEKMKEELEGAPADYALIRTNLAREVYSKLINDLDYQPQVTNLTWVERLAQLINVPEATPQITGGAAEDGEFHETDNQQEAESQQSQSEAESPQSTNEVSEKCKKESKG